MFGHVLSVNYEAGRSGNLLEDEQRPEMRLVFEMERRGYSEVGIYLH